MAVEMRRFEWTETSTFHAYVVVPEDFDVDDFDCANALAEINSDIHFEGLERTVDSCDLVPWLAVPPNEAREEIDWTGHSLWT